MSIVVGKTSVADTHCKKYHNSAYKQVVRIPPPQKPKYLSYWLKKVKSKQNLMKLIPYHRTLVKSALRKFNFLISQPKHMLWVLKYVVGTQKNRLNKTGFF